MGAKPPLLWFGAIACHMRYGKAIRWHIDNLTEAGRALSRFVQAGQRLATKDAYL